MTIKVTVKHEYDDSPDSSWLGEFSQRWQPGALKRPISDLPYPYDRDMRGKWFYYVPMNSIGESRQWYTDHGYSRHEAYTLAQKHALEDYNRLLGLYNDQWCFIGVVATVTLDGVTLGCASCWGIESDDKDGIHEVEQEIISEALTEAQKTFDQLTAVPVDWEYELERA